MPRLRAFDPVFDGDCRIAVGISVDIPLESQRNQGRRLDDQLSRNDGVRRLRRCPGGMHRDSERQTSGACITKSTLHYSCSSVARIAGSQQVVATLWQIDDAQQ